VLSLILSQWQTLYLSLSLSLPLSVPVSGVEPDPKSVMDPVLVPQPLSPSLSLSLVSSLILSQWQTLYLSQSLSLFLRHCLFCRV
jgi:hypothetical protein